MYFAIATWEKKNDDYTIDRSCSCSLMNENFEIRDEKPTSYYSFFFLSLSFITIKNKIQTTKELRYCFCVVNIWDFTKPADYLTVRSLLVLKFSR